MTVTVPRQRLTEALSRIRTTLVDAAGTDKILSAEDLELALRRLPPTERAAVDAFVRALKGQQKALSTVTVRDIDRAVGHAINKLAPPQVTDISTEEVVKAERFGAGLVGLAARLAGEPAAQLPQLDLTVLEGKSGDELKNALRELCSPHVRFDYGTARDVMYGHVDAEDGKVRDVYTGREAPVKKRADMEQIHQFNAEHTRPQSLGADGTARTDLHHLFPTDAEANNRRGNLPFGIVVTVMWEKSGSRMGADASGVLVFEPPDDHKGDVARALFYMSAIYGLDIADAEERVLRSWHVLDPVDAHERRRNDLVAAHQENRNPFVDAPGLVDKIKTF